MINAKVWKPKYGNGSMKTGVQKPKYEVRRKAAYVSVFGALLADVSVVIVPHRESSLMPQRVAELHQRH